MTLRNALRLAGRRCESRFDHFLSPHRKLCLSKDNTLTTQTCQRIYECLCKQAGRRAGSQSFVDLANQRQPTHQRQTKTTTEKRRLIFTLTPCRVSLVTHGLIISNAKNLTACVRTVSKEC